MNSSTHTITILSISLAMIGGLGCASGISSGERVDVASDLVRDRGAVTYDVYVDPGLWDVSLLSPDGAEIGRVTYERSDAERYLRILLGDQEVEALLSGDEASFWLNGDHVADVSTDEMRGDAEHSDDLALASIEDELGLAAAVLMDPSVLEASERLGPELPDVAGKQVALGTISNGIELHCGLGITGTSRWSTAYSGIFYFLECFAAGHTG